MGAGKGMECLSQMEMFPKPITQREGIVSVPEKLDSSLLERKIGAFFPFFFFFSFKLGTK